MEIVPTHPYHADFQDNPVRKNDRFFTDATIASLATDNYRFDLYLNTFSWVTN